MCCRLEDPNDFGFEWETIFDRAQARGLEVAYYVSDLPVPALYGPRGLDWVRPASQFYLDAATGSLPPICFVDPPFRDGGGGNGISADEHPHGDIRLGQAFMSDVAHALIESPQYRRGAMFINYDEWGGFFDHVRPRHVPDDRANLQDLENDWSITGFRVPAVAISPFTRGHRKGGRVSHMTCTHESILKLIAYRYRLGFLNKRHRYASNIGRSFDFSKRDFEPPTLPDPAAIAAIPCAAGGSGVRRSTTWSSSRLRDCSTGSATRSRRSATTRCSGTRTGSAAPSRPPAERRERGLNSPVPGA